MPRGYFKSNQEGYKGDKSRLKRWTDSDDISDGELIAQWTDWVHNCINRWGQDGDEHREDIFQEVALKLCKMGKDGRPYSSYVARAVIQNVAGAMSVIRRGGFTRSVKGSRSFPDQLEALTRARGVSKANHANEGVFQPEAPDTVAPGDAKMDIDKALAQLDPREARVVRLYWLEGMTMDEAGAELGVTKERVRQIQNKALAKIKAAMEEGVLRSRFPAPEPAAAAI